MDENYVGCIICGAPIVYTLEQKPMECQLCHKTFLSSASCSNGHYVCDSCHSRLGSTSIMDTCLSTKEKDPIKIALKIMKSSGIHMHGPEHHILAGSSLITAYHNNGGKLDLKASLNEMAKRGMQAPGGVCGLWGSCGAALSCGMAYSIIKGSTPMSVDTWGSSNLITSRCLNTIGMIGGPRCCKRDTFLALREATDFINQNDEIKIEIDNKIICTFSDTNNECIRKRCPFYKF